MATISDALTTNGSLTVTPGGAAWTQRRGTFTVTGGALTIPEAATTSPLATVNLGTGAQDVSVDVAIADAVYARVLDLDNWWRLRLKATAYQQAYISTEHERKETFDRYLGGVLDGSNVEFMNWFPDMTTTSPPSETQANGFTYVLKGSLLTGNTRSGPVYYSTTNVYEAVLENCVAGTVSFTHSWALPGKPTRLRIVAQGSNLKSYTNLGARSLGSAPTGTEAVTANATGQTNPHAGIGKGGPSDSIGAVGLRNFTAISLIDAPLAPALGAPLPGAYVDTSAAFQVAHGFSSPNPGDTMTAHSIRFRYAGLTRWLTSLGTLVATEAANTKLVAATVTTVPGGLIPLGNTVNWTAKVWNAADVVSALTTESVFQANAAPVVTLTGPPAIEVDTSRPIVTASVTDAEGDTIDLARARVYRAETVGEVNITTDTPEWDSGLVPVTAVGGVVSMALGGGSDLTNGVGYVVAFQVSGSTSAPSSWALRAFRLNIAGPGLPVLAVSYDQSRHAVLTSATAQVNQLASNQSDLRHGLSDDGVLGWLAANANTLAPAGVEGVGMKLTTTGPNDMAVEITGPLPTLPGQAYTDLAEVALVSGSSTGNWHIETTIFDAEGTIIGVTSGEVVPEQPSTTEPVPPTDPGPQPASYRLEWDRFAAYPTPMALQTATLDTDPAFIRLTILSGPPKPITRVEWSYKTQAAGSYTTYRLNDTTAPYEMHADPNGVPLATFPIDGSHMVKAHVVYNDATSDDVIGSFNVLHPVVPGTTVPVFTLKFGSGPQVAGIFPGPKPLAGATLTGLSWVYLDWVKSSEDPVIASVDWYYRAGTSDPWIPARIGVDVAAPYEFDFDPAPPPLDPSLLGPSGQYQIRAVVNFVDPLL